MSGPQSVLSQAREIDSSRGPRRGNGVSQRLPSSIRRPHGSRQRENEVAPLPARRTGILLRSSLRLDRSRPIPALARTGASVLAYVCRCRVVESLNEVEDRLACRIPRNSPARSHGRKRPEPQLKDRIDGSAPRTSRHLFARRQSEVYLRPLVLDAGGSPASLPPYHRMRSSDRFQPASRTDLARLRAKKRRGPPPGVRSRPEATAGPYRSLSPSLPVSPASLFASGSPVPSGMLRPVNFPVPDPPKALATRRSTHSPVTRTTGRSPPPRERPRLGFPPQARISRSIGG